MRVLPLTGEYFIAYYVDTKFFHTVFVFKLIIAANNNGLPLAIGCLANI